jgi:hypothetical protein
MNRDYFAEMYVAGILADRGWNVYFPRRDNGFDCIVTKEVNGVLIIRPVQVKGKYPIEGKGDHIQYGFKGELSQVHPEMVLAVPFFTQNQPTAPVLTAFMPYQWLKKLRGVPNGYRTFPAGFADGSPYVRRDYASQFGDSGLTLMESTGWSALLPPPSPVASQEVEDGDPV